VANPNGLLGRGALGRFVLGKQDSASLTNARLTQNAVEVLDVYPPGVLMTALSHELFYSPVPNSVISQIAIEVLSQKQQSLLLTQQAFEILDQYLPYVRMTEIAAEILDTYSPLARVTTLASEILDVYSPGFRVTQESAEILYQNIAPPDVYFTTALRATQSIAHSSDINRTVVSAITIRQIIAGQDYPVSLTTSLSVAQTVLGKNSTIHAAITTNIAVAPTIRVNRDILRSASSDITLTPTVVYHPLIVELSVQSDITVTQTVRENEEVALSVTSNITVSQTVEIHSADVDMSVTSEITVEHSIAFRNTVVRISMMQEIGAAQGSTEQSDHQLIEDDIGVDCIIVARNTNVRADLFSTLTLTATVFARSTIIHETVISDIAVAPTITAFNPNIEIRSDVTVAQLIETANTVVRIELESGITVDQTIRHDPNHQQLRSDITVDGSGFGTAIQFYLDPVHYTMVQPIYLADSIVGGSSNRTLSVQSDILVTPEIRTNFPKLSVLSEIALTQTVIGGGSNREIALQDTLLVAQSVASRNSIVRLTVHQGVSLHQTILDQTEEVFLDVIQNIIINPTIATRVAPHIRMVQAIEAHQEILARPDNNNQFITENLTVTQSLRSSPNYQTVVQPVTVSARIRQLFQNVRSEIVVDQTINQERSRLVIQQVPITQLLTANRVVNRTIRSEISVTPIIRANHDYIRNLITRVPIAEGFYPIRVDFHDFPILIPVATGVIVSATLMSIRSEHGVIVLPPAQLGDSVANIGRVEIRKSMDGTAFSYVQGTDRRKLTYKWLLPHLKVYELRSFVRVSVSDLLMLENWKGETWAVKLTKNPFDFQNQGVWERDREFAEVEMTFEGLKIA
jgi:hypothetical protein